MAEVTLAKPLNGLEIRQAVISKLQKSMMVDCRLADHMAYGAIRIKVRVDLELLSSAGAAETKTAHEVYVQEGGMDPDMIPLTVEFSEDAEPPNKVRMETAQPIPILSVGNNGRAEEKAITYRSPEFVAKPAAKKSVGRPRS